MKPWFKPQHYKKEGRKEGMGGERREIREVKVGGAREGGFPGATVYSGGALTQHS